MGQGQKPLHMTYLLLAVNICTKYKQDPSSGNKLWNGHYFVFTDGQTYTRAGGRIDTGDDNNPLTTKDDGYISPGHIELLECYSTEYSTWRDCKHFFFSR